MSAEGLDGQPYFDFSEPFCFCDECDECQATWRERKHRLSCSVVRDFVGPILGDRFDAWVARKRTEGWL